MNYFKIWVLAGMFLSVNSSAQIADTASADATTIDSLNTSIICHTDNPLTKAQPESTWGNIVADAQLWYARQKNKDVDASVLNQGCLRASYLSPGAIMVKDIYALLPFNNRLVIVQLDGAQIILLCNLIAEKGGWPVSGVTFDIAEDKAENILIKGNPINQHLVYKIVMPDYLAYGGSGCTFLKTAKKKKTNKLLRNTVVEYLQSIQQKSEKLDMKIEGRIKYKD